MTMTSKMTSKTTSPPSARRRVTIERTFDAPVEDVWELWTTKEGIESWWGPDGFRVEVRQLDLRPGGELHYDMIAVAPEQIAFMNRSGMPVSQRCRLTYTEITPLRRLSYVHLVDFVPGVEPYELVHVVDLHPTARGVRMVLTFEAMHDERWTEMAAQGWEMELGKLARALAH